LNQSLPSPKAGLIKGLQARQCAKHTHHTMKNLTIKTSLLAVILLFSAGVNAAPSEKEIANSWAENFITSCYQDMNQFPEKRECFDKILEAVYTLKPPVVSVEKGDLKDK